LIWEFSKNLVHLKFSASSICMKIFYIDFELWEIRGNCDYARIDQFNNYAIRKIILNCCRQKKIQYCKDHIQRIFKKVNNKLNVHLKTSIKLLLNHEEEQWKHLIQNLKSNWKWKIICWQSTCRLKSWFELQHRINLIKAKIEWILASKIYHFFFTDEHFID